MQIIRPKANLKIPNLGQILNFWRIAIGAQIICRYLKNFGETIEKGLGKTFILVQQRREGFRQIPNLRDVIYE